MTSPRGANRYAQIIEHIFRARYTEGSREVPFERADIERAAAELGIKLPKNLGDVLYSYRYRVALPNSIQLRAPPGEQWVIRPAGRSCYRFVANPISQVAPNAALSETKIPDATPGIIAKYALNDEQALLAKVRYNRLIDIFTGIACYSLQSHLRTSVQGVGQVETDEVYVGVDRRGAQFVFPVQAKGARDRLSVVQIEQDVAVCRAKFPNLLCVPIGAQFVEEDLIALFRFELGYRGVSVETERHYRLVPADQITPEDLQAYSTRTDRGMTG